MIPLISTTEMPNSLKREFTHAVRKTLDRDSLIDGEECRGFEKKFGEYLGGLHCVGVGNGYDALYALIIALSLPSRSRIGVPVHTFAATWLSIINAGHIPIGIDIDKFGNLNSELLHNYANENLSAVVVVHMHGNPAQIQDILEWCKRQSILLIEDCAQAAGLKISGRHAGTFGVASIFSFYPTKNLFALGDGGAVVTSDPSLASQVRQITRYGSNQIDRNLRKLPAVNSRLDSIQAAILSVGLKHLDEWNYERRRIASIYTELLGESFETNGELREKSVYHHFTLQVESRNRFIELMKQRQVVIGIHYPNLAFDGIYPEKRDFPSASQYTKKTVSLPISPWQDLRTTKRVAREILSVLNCL